MDGYCYDRGSVVDVDGVLSYCDVNWLNQKALDEECVEDYECLSNVCSGVCRNKDNAITGGTVDSVGVKDNRVIGLLMMLIVVFLLYYFLKKKDFK